MCLGLFLNWFELIILLCKANECLLHWCQFNRHLGGNQWSGGDVSQHATPAETFTNSCESPPLDECPEYREDQVYSFGLHINCLISVEDDNFLREGWAGMCEPNDFYLIWEFVRFGLTERALFQVILGLLLVYADWEKGGVCLRVRVCMCVCLMS